MPPSNPNTPSDPYSFIQNNANPAYSGSGSSSFLKPNTTKGRIILASVFAFVILIIFVVVMTILSNAGKDKAKVYVELGQKQTEIIRLASIGEQKGRLLETKSYASNVKLSFVTSQAEVNRVISANGISGKQLSKELTKSKNPASDQILNEAESNNRFDETFLELINSEIKKFQLQLNSVASGSTQAERAILQEAYSQSSLLLGPPPKES